jgi:hypothetical protein
MGPRITVGSATLMNKALEVIELHHLFGLERERIEVVIHPQSIVHSMVEFVDGSVIAQMGPPDMRGPIHYALHHPDRAPSGLPGSIAGPFQTLTFEAPDPALPGARARLPLRREGSDSGSVLNAADEVAVAAFLNLEIALHDIPSVNRRVLDRRPGLDRHRRGSARSRPRRARPSPRRSPVPGGGRLEELETPATRRHRMARALDRDRALRAGGPRDQPGHLRARGGPLPLRAAVRRAVEVFSLGMGPRLFGWRRGRRSTRSR